VRIQVRVAVVHGDTVARRQREAITAAGAWGDGLDPMPQGPYGNDLSNGAPFTRPTPGSRGSAGTP
jgi:hypothetical protein